MKISLQDLVYVIIRTGYKSKLKYITKQQIKDLVKETNYGKLDRTKYDSYRNRYNRKETKLDMTLTQALYHLKKNGKIRQACHGGWSI